MKTESGESPGEGGGELAVEGKILILYAEARAHMS